MITLCLYGLEYLKGINVNIKNAVYKNIEKTIVDVEIEHPSYGWIPYTFNNTTPDESFDVLVREYLLSATILDYSAPSFTIEQAKSFKQNSVQSSFDAEVKALSDALPHEMTSWRKQEEQARAWNVDNTVDTPIIDAILLTRNLGETKQQFVDIVIRNADAYETAYGTILGKFQNLTRAISNATTVDEVEECKY